MRKVRKMLGGCAVSLLFLLLAGQGHAATSAAGGHRYIVILNAAPSGEKGLTAGDIEQAGGKVEGQTTGELIVTLTSEGVEALRQNPAVRSLQRVAVNATEAAASGVLSSVPPRRSGPVANQAPPQWRSGAYQYDGMGNITAVGTTGSPDGDNIATSYTYDTLSRLKGVSATRLSGSSGQPGTESYNYDAYGNLTQLTTRDGDANGVAATVKTVWHWVEKTKTWDLITATPAR